MTTRLEPVDLPFMPTVTLSPDALVTIAGGEVVTWAECQRRMIAAAPAPDGMRGAIVAAVSANVHVNDGQTVIDGPAIAAAIIAIIAKGEGR